MVLPPAALTTAVVGVARGRRTGRAWAALAVSVVTMGAWGLWLFART